MKQIIAIAILGSLMLLGGCADNPTDIPDVLGYSGYVSLGWEKYSDSDFQMALDYFLDAVDIDPSRPEAYLGAGWASLYLPDVWVIADNYFYMAIQEKAGYYPLSGYAESQVQDTMWTKFECLHPDLPSGVLDPILEQTAANGIVWVGTQIHDIVGDVNMPYRFQTVNTGAIAMFEAVNGYTTGICEVDSIAGGWVYLTAPFSVIQYGEPSVDYYTWINVDNQVNYEYRVFDMSGSPGGQIFYDALAGCCMLQDIRGEYGDPLLGNASAWALDNLNSDYTFGSGKQYEGYEVISNLQLKGTAASLAFAQTFFKFAWFTCVSEVTGITFDPSSPDFITSLMAVIEIMLNS